MQSIASQSDTKSVRLGREMRWLLTPGFISRRRFMTIALLASDLMALATAGGIAIWLRAEVSLMAAFQRLGVSAQFDSGVYLHLIPLLGLFPAVYASRGLYPSTGLNRVDEFRLLTISTSLMAGIYATVLFFAQRGSLYSRLVFGLFWLLALLLVPAARVAVRKILAGVGLWGVPVGVVGVGPRTRWTKAFLRNHPNLGYLPTIEFDGVEDTSLADDHSQTRCMQTLRDLASLKRLRSIDTLVMVQDETPEDLLADLVRHTNHAMPRVVLMPDLPEIGSIWVRPIDLGGVLALKIGNNLANRREQVTKRFLDIAAGLVIFLVSVPIAVFIAAAIKLESHGPIFYAHHRIGADGQGFRCWKFRTMVPDADQRLQAYLKQDPERYDEWQATRKLKDDPRITRLGRWLRKTSLDELPQLWNVLKGDMSLVGPRPIVAAEAEHYQQAIDLYHSVRPGITGLWQVSGRNDMGYGERVSLDSYYVRNWSVWMDLYILARTPVAVLTRNGAY